MLQKQTRWLRVRERRGKTQVSGARDHTFIVCLGRNTGQIAATVQVERLHLFFVFVSQARLPVSMPRGRCPCLSLERESCLQSRSWDMHQFADGMAMGEAVEDRIVWVGEGSCEELPVCTRMAAWLQRGGETVGWILLLRARREIAYGMASGDAGGPNRFGRGVRL